MKNILHKVMMTAAMLTFTTMISAQRPGSDYTVKGTTVQYAGKNIPSAQASSFVDLGYGYAKDAYSVYYNGQILPYVDPQGFRLKGNAGDNPGNGQGQDGGHGHSGAQNNGYQLNVGHGNNGAPNNGNNQGVHLNPGVGHATPGHGPGNQGAGHGNRHYPAYMVSGWEVYYEGHKVQGATASSFKDLGFGYGKDVFNVYYFGEKIKGASGSSFELLVDGYSKDAFNAYYRGQKINGSSGNSFKVLTDGYSMDAFNAYYFGEKVSGASVHSFRVDGNGYAHDAFNTYYYGKKAR